MDPAKKGREEQPARVPAVARLPFFESDVAVVRAVRAGQSAGGAALYDRHHAHVRRVLVRVLGPDAELGDLIQDVFAAAIDSIDRLDDPEALKSWLGGIAVHRARAEIRRRARRRWFPLFSRDRLPEVEAPVSTPEIDEAVRATYRVLSKLSADERIAFSLRYVDGMELMEVAEVCGHSLATTKRRLARAKRKFASIASTYPELADWLKGGATWK
jgi:RNA polymerase sigma-70 factor (ECF subfamily)